MWKPGQIVTINGKRYRVKRSSRLVSPCPDCEFFRSSNNICDNICFPDQTSKLMLDDDCYLELIRGKADSPTK